MPAKALTLGRPVYRGYMPPDLPQHRPPNRIKPWWKVIGKPKFDIYPKQEPEEWADTAEYPPLSESSIPNGYRHKARHDWYKLLQRLPTFEQKHHEISRHCDHYIAHLNNWIGVHDGLSLAQYLTRTYFVNALPDSYRVTASDSSGNEPHDRLTLSANKQYKQPELVARIKPLLLNQIALEKYESEKLKTFISQSIRENNRLQHVQDSLIHGLVNSLRRALAPDLNQQLLDYQIDNSPAIRSWWYHSGFKPPNKKVYYRSRLDKDGNINQMVQVDGRSAINFRSDNLLEPIVDFNSELVTDSSLIVPKEFNLRNYDARYKFKRPVALPGFWYEDTPKYDCPHTCFLTTDALRLRNDKYHNLARPLDDDENALNCQAILSAFSWLNSLSMYHGYTPFHELDYPLTCQVVTTDGQNWLFNVFQMNTHTFHRDFEAPPKNNICWSSGLMKLYEQYDGDGQFSAVNDEVLELIIRFFGQQTSPGYTKSLNLRPHLGEDTRSIEDKDEIRRAVRNRMENRKDTFLAADWFVPMFEHIYFRSPEARNQIRHMKARWHIPKPKTPIIFD